MKTATEKRRTRTSRPAAPVRVGKVFLAEDDVEMRRLASCALQQDGWEVVETANGSELLEELEAAAQRNESVDLVITDVRMPGFTGLQVLDWLQRVRAWSAPVIVITGFGDEKTHLQARRLGAPVLDKPFELDDLRVLARVALERKRIVQPSSPAGPPARRASRRIGS
jgi:DNA-binding response OmpR family regulator